MRWLAGGVRALVIVFAAALLVFSSAQAANTLVTVVVCSPANGAQINLTQPLTDSTVNNATVTVAGRATQAEAVNVSVDGVLQTTVPLTSLDQNFSTTVTLTQGTHTISLAARDMCHALNGAINTVVTYIPGAVPSQGGSVPTDIPSQNHPPVTGPPVAPPIGRVAPLQGLPKVSAIPTQLVDEAQPAKPVNPAPLIVAAPFVVGAGAFGWIHIRRLLH